MKKLKSLNQEELDEISDFLSSTAIDYILSKVSSKELLDIDVNIEISYKTELDVDMSIALDFDEFSSCNNELINQTIDISLSALDSFLDSYRE
ncbi:DUF3194 domain-containing protein [Methanobrevibacter filiformis]|uniref:DUF3194 domain-containing protein n=1 Tax=Methanobrevibacter filiformis TaxID=55758 RepID=A0A166AZN2_9EURY|nr:DUF3194 domain-containing protein [Methanobrevibacter filiformis]KZX12674.1 hypothetical protein MBFIL_10740 [Methanobrevibacter filiformis]